MTDATNPELEAALREAAGAEGLELTQQQVRCQQPKPRM